MTAIYSAKAIFIFFYDGVLCPIVNRKKYIYTNVIWIVHVTRYTQNCYECFVCSLLLQVFQVFNWCYFSGRMKHLVCRTSIYTKCRSPARVFCVLRRPLTAFNSEEPRVIIYTLKSVHPIFTGRGQWFSWGRPDSIISRRAWLDKNTSITNLFSIKTYINF